MDCRQHRDAIFPDSSFAFFQGEAAYYRYLSGGNGVVDVDAFGGE